ncbi:hypothetical protein EST38_g10927 [Candolleomyces aberdarensis]|uniref:Fungal-type protein kinase domain-containing protein n=1 Tax=Candolleomyces aberdarensis TaxID=2316362 RepID=A0A4Q2D672_9AGAR|nr:hypothetical protein EST38_g10927 [Candolleomyces aberdarensis]
MTTTTILDVGVDDSRLPTAVKGVQHFGILTRDRLDANDTDDECDQSYSDVDDSDDEFDRANVASALLEDPVEKACTTANNEFSTTQDSGTPWKPTTHRVKEFEGSNKVKERLFEELGPADSIPRADIVQWISPAYEHLATEDHINEFLSESGEYHKRRWRVIPRAPKLEKQLYEPICELWNAILGYFGPPGIADMRKAFVTDRVPLKHHAMHTSSPDICIEASGPSFTLAPGEMISFSNIATFADGKLERDALNLRAHMLQMGGYARTDESMIGLDKSFQWITGPEGAKLGGLLETVRDDQTIIKYDLDMEEEIFSRTSIRGRGTVCWPVKDSETGERFLVKDYWMSEGRTPEYELLEEVRYTPGLCHMISHEERRAETKSFRGDPSAFTQGTFHNRKSIRITIKFYGTSIDNFRTPEEMLAALRDAIQAHQTLYSIGILHRDITHSNILIGIKGFESEDGERGVIIDLDMAIKNRRPILDICKDFRTGTLMFQSIMVSRFFAKDSDDQTPHPAQDYLDDLESFFWLLVFLLFMYKPNGEKLPPHSFHNQIWSFENEVSSYSMKSVFINNPSTLHDAEQAIDPDWHPACYKLFLNFYDFIHRVHQEKESGIGKRKGPLPDGIVPNRYTDLLHNVNDDYKYIIKLFDAALIELKEDAVKQVPLEPLINDTPSSPLTEAPVATTMTPKKPRTRSLRRGSPLVELSLTERTPKRKDRNSDTESDQEESPTMRLKSKRRCYPGPSGLSQAESIENDTEDMSTDDGHESDF